MIHKFYNLYKMQIYFYAFLINNNTFELLSRMDV